MGKRKDYAQQKSEWAKRREDMAALHAQGWSYAKIGRRYQKSRQRIAQLLGAKP